MDALDSLLAKLQLADNKPSISISTDVDLDLDRLVIETSKLDGFGDLPQAWRTLRSQRQPLRGMQQLFPGLWERLCRASTSHGVPRRATNGLWATNPLGLAKHKAIPSLT